MIIGLTGYAQSGKDTVASHRKGVEMTHDELLDRIAQAGLEPDGNVMPTHLVLALRAVVELHKPDIPYGLHDAVEACPMDGDVYPCSTIQAIEKELG
jgi:hypothetical protein